MPGPPPPPPPGMMPPPPPPAPMALPKGGKPDDRAALLKSIQKGTRLKKATTNDRSAPVIGGKTSNNNSNSNSSSPSSAGGTPTSAPNGLNLGGLFAGGMPKLKPTGKLGPINQNSSNFNNNEHASNRRPAPLSQPIKNSSTLQNELKKQLASDNKNRGPPPPAPVRSMPEENGTRQLPPLKIGSTNGLHVNQSVLHSNFQPQNSTLHRKVKSNANLNSLDSPEPINGFNQINKPVISHGKPNVAPKPPVLNAKPIAPPKKLLVNGKPVSRAHSMKSPRTPSPQSPDTNVQLKFGTVRNLSSVIGQSLANSTGNLSPRPRPTINGRPNAPPPSIPTQPPVPPPHANQPPLPPSKTGFVKPPNHAPPPPPSSALPQPPSHTPPPPPHRMLPSRAPPAVPNNNFAPPPPPRNSSMTSTRKAAVDVEEKYRAMFRDPSTFPKPPPFRNVFKMYGGKQAGSKQQAPQPPVLQSTSRTWDVSPAC